MANIEVPGTKSSSRSDSQAEMNCGRFEAYATYIKHILQYLRTGCHSPGLEEKTKKAIRKATSKGQYVAEGSTVFYCQSGRQRRVITNQKERESILYACHSAPSAGHTGINNTCCKITERYWWKGVREDVTDWIDRCDACQRHEKLKTQAPQLHPIEVKSPLYMVGMDLIGPLKETPTGYKYVLTFTDYFTKFVDLYALRSKSAEEVCRGIRRFVYTWGPPEKLLSDRGKEFVNLLNNELSAKFGIQRLVTSAYHPQCNGLDERTNQSLKDRLAKLVNECQDNWDNFLDEVAYSLRTQKQASTKFSPFFLMFHRQPRLIVEEATEDEQHPTELQSEEVTEEDLDNFMGEITKSLDDVHTQVLNNIDLAQKRQVEQYSKRKAKGVKVFEFEVGNLVLRREMKNVGRKGDKMAPKWTGPYRIIKIDNRQRVELQHLHNGLPLKAKVPYVQLKPYNQSDVDQTASTIVCPTKPHSVEELRGTHSSAQPTTSVTSTIASPTKAHCGEVTSGTQSATQPLTVMPRATLGAWELTGMLKVAGVYSCGYFQHGNKWYAQSSWSL